MDELFCYTCRGTDFYEDRMGNFSCKRCGAVSQDYFAVSHEIDVSAPLARASIRTIKTKVFASSHVAGLRLLPCLDLVVMFSGPKEEGSHSGRHHTDGMHHDISALSPKSIPGDLAYLLLI